MLDLRFIFPRESPSQFDAAGGRRGHRQPLLALLIQSKRLLPWCASRDHKTLKKTRSVDNSNKSLFSCWMVAREENKRSPTQQKQQQQPAADIQVSMENHVVRRSWRWTTTMLSSSRQTSATVSVVERRIVLSVGFIHFIFMHKAKQQICSRLEGRGRDTCAGERRYFFDHRSISGWRRRLENHASLVDRRMLI